MSDFSAVDAHVYVGDGIHLHQSAGELLALMDEANTQFAVVCPVDRYLAVDNREGNELVLAAALAHPGRLAAMASVNPWFGDRAVAELKRALSAGCAAIKLHPVYQGFRLADPIIFPLLDIAAEHDVPVYAHSGTAGLAEPFHVAELARRYESVNFVMVHSGASDYYQDTVAAVNCVSNLWIETSRNGPGNYCMFKNRDCTARVVFGSSSPEYIPAIEMETLRDVFTERGEQEQIFAGNIREVFKGKTIP